MTNFSAKSVTNSFSYFYKYSKANIFQKTTKLFKEIFSFLGSTIKHSFTNVCIVTELNSFHLESVFNFVTASLFKIEELTLVE
jgi:hypothetical protein